MPHTNYSLVAGSEERRAQAEVYVAGLPWTAEEEDVAKFLAEYGDAIEVRLIRDRHTNRSRGFAFVTLELHPGVAENAWRAADGKYMAGRRIIVQPPRESGREREGKGSA